MALNWKVHFNAGHIYRADLAGLQRIGLGGGMYTTTKDREKILLFWKTHGLQAASDAYAVSRATLFRWQADITPKRRVRHTQVRRAIPVPIRTEILRLKRLHPELGKGQLQPLLARFCAQGALQAPSESTVGRYLNDLKREGVLSAPVRLKLSGATGRLIEKPLKRKHKLRRNGYAPGIPGDLLQIDTVVTFINGLRRYTVTAIDLPSRFSFAWSYSSLSSATSVDFLGKLRLAAPFQIKRFQTDNGLEFHGRFQEALKKQGSIQFFNRPRNPKQNAFIERFNRTIQEEFLYRNADSLAYDLPTHNQKLMDYLIYYNAERPHTGLGKKTPLEYLHISSESQRGWTTTVD
jgi:transposase InsO family protein